VKAVEAQWDAELAALPQRLSARPAATWGELIAGATKLSVRRFFGIIAIAAIELAILAVLATALWQVGYGFISARYAASDLIYNTLALVILLLIAGHLLANFFFPSLRRRFQAELTRRLQATIARSAAQMDTALREHVEAIDRLAAKGRDLQGAIDRIVHGLRQSADGAAVDRLFRKADGEATPTARRTARFE
jgi:hypothetical protein